MEQTDRILISRRTVTPEGVVPAAVWLSGERIQSVTTPAIVPSDAAVQDLGDRVLMPALVDTHVHINEPGRTEWEGFITATRAAAAGGITTLIDMPLNSDPVTTTVDALHRKLEAAQGKLQVDCGFYGGVIPGNAGELRGLALAGVRGFKCFLIHSGIDDFPNVTEADLREAMPILAELGLPLLVHAELDCGSPIELPPVTDARSYRRYLASRPHQWELDAIVLMIRLCRETHCPVHIVHLSSADALPMLRAAKDEGLPITVETCVHYLTLAAEDVPDGDTRYKCAPPIREKENADRLWQGLMDGTIDFIISDHSPCTPELKRLETGNFEEAWGGISGLQFGLPAIWTEITRRNLGLMSLARWMCINPAHFAGLAMHKGTLQAGAWADFIIWDPETSFTVHPDMVLHRHKVTPYEGRTLFGKIEQTWMRGRLVAEHGQPVGLPAGQPLLAKTPVSSPPVRP